MDLELLRKIFEDKRQHVAVAQITKIAIASDFSSVKCMVKVFPDGREIVARMTWEVVGPESGDFTLPSVEDLVLVAFADGEIDDAFIIRRLSSKVDKLPAVAATGDMVRKALPGKRSWLIATKHFFGMTETEPTENLVLGQVLKTLLTELLTKVSEISEKVSTHTHPGNLGYPTGAPIQAADFVSVKTAVDNLKSSPVQDGAMLSDIAFTEKGS